jgi:predicted nuclease of predicted toxin-antitoxin system
MKFLVDAQLPRRLAAQFRQAGIEAIHTLDLPDANRTSDRIINELSIKEQYVVVTKDSGFVESFLLRREPWKLFLISTGNISNSDLESLLQSGMVRIVEGFRTLDFIELSRDSIIFHA